MTLVILAAGLGSRYGGLKQLDPMTDNGEFIIDFSIYDAIRAGFDHVVFLIKEENLEQFRETIGNRIEKKIKVSYAIQDGNMLPAGFTAPEGRTKPWGTGHAIYCIRDLVKENFAVINADDFYGRDTYVQLAKHLATAKTENGVGHQIVDQHDGDGGNKPHVVAAVGKEQGHNDRAADTRAKIDNDLNGGVGEGGEQTPFHAVHIGNDDDGEHRRHGKATAHRQVEEGEEGANEGQNGGQRQHNGRDRDAFGLEGFHRRTVLS